MAARGRHDFRCSMRSRRPRRQRIYRSHTGARLAVEQAQMLLVDEVLPRIKDGSAHEDMAQFKKQLEHQLPKDLLRRWRDSVRQDASDRPITENRSSDSCEQNSKEYEETEPEIPSEQRYGATLLAALLTPDLHLYIQLEMETFSPSPQRARSRVPLSRETATLSRITPLPFVRKRLGVSYAYISSQ